MTAYYLCVSSELMGEVIKISPSPIPKFESFIIPNRWKDALDYIIKNRMCEFNPKHSDAYNNWSILRKCELLAASSSSATIVIPASSASSSSVTSMQVSGISTGVSGINSGDHPKTNDEYIKFIQDESWILEYFIPQPIEITSPATAQNWKRMLNNVGFSRAVKILDDRIQQASITKRISRTLTNDEIDIKRLKIEASFTEFKTTKSSASASNDRKMTDDLFPLSTIHLESGKLATLMEGLGNIYDLKCMTDDSDISDRIQRYQNHVEMTKRLSEFKFNEQKKPSKAEIRSYLLHHNIKNIKIDDVLKTILVGESLIQARNATKKKSQYTLDPWQQQVISLVEEKKSVIVIGPTSGGKTFTSMALLSSIIDGESTVCYVAPTFHLAFQTYSNVTKTFPKYRSALITGDICNIPQNAQIWIGTPVHLLTYIKTIKITFDVGIFDEFHVISTSFGNSVESAAMMNLVKNKICTKQILALSATVHPDDVKILKENLTQLTGFSFESVEYKERSVPLIRHIFSGNQLLPAIPDEKINVPEIISPESTFNLIHLLKFKEYLPCIFFEMSNSPDEDCFKNYVNLVEWIETRENAEYKNWHRLRDEWRIKLESVNKQLTDIQFKVMNKRSSGYDSAISLRMKTIVSIQENLATAIIKNMSTETKSMQMPNDVKTILATIANSHSSSINPDQKFISIETNDLCLEYKNYYMMNIDEKAMQCLDLIPVPCNRDGPYFCVGAWNRDLDTFKYMQLPAKNKEQEKIVSTRDEMLQGEHITLKEIDHLTKLIDRGLRYGIGLILPTMPFVIQYYILKMISARKIPLIFASESMSMGINYPFKSVVIKRSNGGRSSIHSASSSSADAVVSNKITSLLQMEGRAGRRRLDKEGHVIFWNVPNVNHIDTNHIPRIIFPRDQKGSLIGDPFTIATTIESERLQNLDVTALMAIVIGMRDSNFVNSRDPDENNASIIVKNRNANKLSFIKPLLVCCGPLIASMKLLDGTTDISQPDLISRIEALARGNIQPNFKTNAYMYAEKINLLKHGVLELHTRYYLCGNDKWNTYMRYVFELLHRVQYRQIRF